MTERVPCPVTQAKGAPVATATLKCLLSVSLAAIADDTYYFCPDPACEVVYFTADGSSLFRHTQLRERVYQKAPQDDEVLVCYCFHYTRGQIRREVEATGESAIAAEIAAHVRADKCACDWRNPQGTCCLGNVKQLVARYRTRHDDTGEEPEPENSLAAGTPQPVARLRSPADHLPSPELLACPFCAASVDGLYEQPDALSLELLPRACPGCTALMLFYDGENVPTTRELWMAFTAEFHHDSRLAAQPFVAIELSPPRAIEDTDRFQVYLVAARLVNP